MMYMGADIYIYKAVVYCSGDGNRKWNEKMENEIIIKRIIKKNVVR